MISSGNRDSIQRLVSELVVVMQNPRCKVEEIYSKISHSSTETSLQSLLISKISRRQIGKTLKSYIEEKAIEFSVDGALLIDRINILVASEQSRQPASARTAGGGGVASSSVPLYFSRRIYTLPSAIASSASKIVTRLSSAASSSSPTESAMLSSHTPPPLLTNQEPYLNYNVTGEEGREHPLLGWILDPRIPDLDNVEFDRLTEVVKDNEIPIGCPPLLQILYNLLDDCVVVAHPNRSTVEPIPSTSTRPVASSSSSSSASSSRTISQGINDIDKLIEAAKGAKKPTLSLYLENIKLLIDNRSNLNAVGADLESVTLKALRKILHAGNAKEKQIAFAVFSNLLAKRQPIDEMSLYRTLHFCSEKYRRGPLSNDDYIHNYAVLDIAISRLLGIKFSSIEVFSGGGENYYKHIGHIAEMKGDVLDPESKKTIKLQGHSADNFSIIHLRFFLQFLVESVESDNNHEFFYQEFLHETEMCWLNLLTYKWKDSLLASNDGDTRTLSEILGKYVLRQIRALKDKCEYSLQLGWRGHSICNVFRREGGEIHPRIDNGGDGIENHLTERKSIAASSTVSRSSPTDRRLYVRPLEFEPFDRVSIPPSIEDYIINLFDYKMGSKWRLSSKKVKGSIYHDFPTPRKSESSLDAHPAQKVGNCVVNSFNLGVIKRIGDMNAWSIQSKECDIIVFLGKIRTHNSDFVAKLEEETNRLLNQPVIPFQTFLLEEVSKYYNSEVADSPFRLNHYLMKAFPVGFNSFKSKLRKGEGDVLDLILKSVREEGMTHIRVMGSAGLGKTTLSRQLVKKCTLQGSASLVFYFPMRHLSDQARYPLCQEGYSLIDVIDKEIISVVLRRSLYLYERQLVEEVLANDPLFVLDGLDELNRLPQMDRALESLTRQKKVVVTARPLSENNGLRLTYNDTYTLEAYTGEEIESFINHYFSQHEGDPHVLLTCKSLLQDALRTHPKLKELCGVPIVLTHLCQCVLDGNTKVLDASNLAGVYSIFVEAMFNRAINRKSRLSLLNTLLPRDQFSEIKLALNFSCFLSFKMLQNSKKLICDLDLLEAALMEFQVIETSSKEGLKRRLTELGLFQVDEFGGEFIHASFQEYLAVRYLIKCLCKSRRTAAYVQAAEFIKTQIRDLKYEHVFLLFFKQLTLQKQLAKTNDDGIQCDRVFKRFFNAFIPEEGAPITSEIVLRTSQLFLSENEFLEDYFSRHEEDKRLYHRFIDRLIDYALTLFVRSSGTFFKTRKNKLLPSGAPLESSGGSFDRLVLSPVDSSALKYLTKFFIEKPEIKERHQVVHRILSALQQHPCVSDSEAVVAMRSSVQASEFCLSSGSSLPIFYSEYDLIKKIVENVRPSQMISEEDQIWPLVADLPVSKYRSSLIPFLHRNFTQKFYNALSNGIIFIQRLEGFNGDTIRYLVEEVINKIDFNCRPPSLTDSGMSVDFGQGIGCLSEKTRSYRKTYRLAAVELLTNRLDILCQVGFDLDSSVISEHLVEITDLCELFISIISKSISEKTFKGDFQLQMMKKVIEVMSLLAQLKHRSERMNELFGFFESRLREYLSLLFKGQDLDFLKPLAELWFHLVPLEKSVSGLIQDQYLERILQKAKDAYKDANEGTNASGRYARTPGFENLHCVLKMSSAIDRLDEGNFGNQLISDLVRIARFGKTEGYVSCSRVRENIKREAWLALSGYDFILTPENYRLHISRIGLIGDLKFSDCSLPNEFYQIGGRIIKRLKDYKKLVVGRCESDAEIDKHIAEIKQKFQVRDRKYL